MNRKTLNRAKGTYMLTEEDLNGGIRLFLESGHYNIYQIEMKHIKILWRQRVMYLASQGVSTILSVPGHPVRLMVVA